MAQVSDNLELPTRQLPQAQLEYLRSARDLKYHEALYEFLSKQLEAARIDEAKDAVVVQVVDKAVVPERKSGPHRATIILLAALGSLSSFVRRSSRIGVAQAPARAGFAASGKAGSIASLPAIFVNCQ